MEEKKKEQSPLLTKDPRNSLPFQNLQLEESSP